MRSLVALAVWMMVSPAFAQGPRAPAHAAKTAPVKKPAPPRNVNPYANFNFKKKPAPSPAPPAQKRKMLRGAEAYFE